MDVDNLFSVFFAFSKSRLNIWKLSVHVLLKPDAAAKSLQSFPTLCNPIGGSPPGSPSLGFSRQEYWNGLPFLLQSMKVKVKSLSPVRLLVTPWTAAYQAPPSMGFSRQEYWSEVPLPSLTVEA